MDDARETPGQGARRLMRSLDRATLGTSLDGWPYASLVLVALDHDASPLLLLSNLAEHTKNIKRERRVSLLFDGTLGREAPLTGPRVTVLGEAQPCDEPRLLARFVARHPSAAGYAEFADFHLYRVTVTRAHLVAGFGQIHWVSAESLLFPLAGTLAEAEADILRHITEDHPDVADLYANRLAGLPGTGWRLTGVDPEGLDLRERGAVTRLDFASPVSDAEGCRRELVRLARKARGEA